MWKLVSGLDPSRLLVVYNFFLLCMKMRLVSYLFWIGCLAGPYITVRFWYSSTMLAFYQALLSSFQVHQLKIDVANFLAMSKRMIARNLSMAILNWETSK